MGTIRRGRSGSQVRGLESLPELPEDLPECALQESWERPWLDTGSGEHATKELVEDMYRRHIGGDQLLVGEELAPVGELLAGGHVYACQQLAERSRVAGIQELSGIPGTISAALKSMRLFHFSCG